MKRLGVLSTLTLFAGATFADTYTVNNTADAGAGSLRQAILDANGHSNSGGPDQIHFAIPGTQVHSIAPVTPLPRITDAVFIDGLTQPGASGASWPPTLKIVVAGNNAGANADGLALEHGASNSTVRGLVGLQLAVNDLGDGLPSGRSLVGARARRLHQRRANFASIRSWTSVVMAG